MEDNRPVMVTIRCAVYNHESFIRQCLDGFIMQQTNFRFEAIVHDDASTDGSADIIREYAAKYPEIIKPIYEIENQYSKKDGSISRIFEKNTNGKYIAICEGDDYWTDSLKLQKQVDFLESHPDYVMCSHRYDSYYQKEKYLEKNTLSDSIEYDIYTLVSGGWFFHPLTVMYRNDYFNFSHYQRYRVKMDAVLFYELLKSGRKGYCLGDTMAVYRIHSKGVWSGISAYDKLDWETDARFAIYEVDQSGTAALFLLNQLSKQSFRKWVLKRLKLFSKMTMVLIHHLGFITVFRLYIIRFLFGRPIAIKKEYIKR